MFRGFPVCSVGLLDGLPPLRRSATCAEPWCSQFGSREEAADALCGDHDRREGEQSSSGSATELVEHFKQHLMPIIGSSELVVPEVIADTELVIRFRVVSQVGDTAFGWPERVGSRVVTLSAPTGQFRKTA
ncbi:hypothetical protein B2J88_41495 [Rhodococcus sp. SRB_17]|nr:hypothetical protein [Rhodococcus sp. SRB_17]